MWNMIIQGNVILSKAIDVNEKKAFLGNLEKRTILVNSDINSAIIVNTAKKNAEILCR
jgi:AAA15 family ATPase/GTPase